MSSGSRRTSSCAATTCNHMHTFRLPYSVGRASPFPRQRRADARRQRAPCPRASKCAALAFNSRPQPALLPSPTSSSPPPSRSRRPSLNTRPPRRGKVAVVTRICPVERRAYARARAHSKYLKDGIVPVGFHFPRAAPRGAPAAEESAPRSSRVSAGIRA